MSPTPANTQVRRIVELANEIEADIRHRRLKTGDRYLRTAETAKMLGVKASLASGALQLLVKRKRLLRRPRAGTVVADPNGDSMSVSIERVNLLSGNRQKTIDIMIDSGEIMGLQEELPGTRIQLSVVPLIDEAKYLESIVAEALASRRAEAFVLNGSTITMQRIISASGLPAVVQGSVYSSVTNLPSLNSDHHRAATLGTEHVLRHGHRRLLVLARQWQSPHGDAVLINAIYRAAQAAGLGNDAIELRFLPEDAAVGRSLAEEFLNASSEPSAIIAFVRIVADAVQELVESRGLTIDEDVPLVTLDYPILPSNPPDYAFIERTVDSVEAGRMLGRVLKQIVQEGAAATPDEIMPVRLWKPKET